MENVKQLVGENNINGFNKWISVLKGLGYTTCVKVLNSKHYGTAQNRERVFAISFYNKTPLYVFPKEIPLQKKFEDYLEDNVDEKYFLKGTKAEELIKKFVEKNDVSDFQCIDLTVNDPQKIDVANCIVARQDNGISNFKSSGFGVLYRIPVSFSSYEIRNMRDVSCSLLSRNYKGVSANSPTFPGALEIKQIGNLTESSSRDNPQAGRVYSVNGLAPTLNTCEGGGRQPFIVVMYKGKPYAFRLRKLTPRECLRLQAVSDEDIDKMVAVNSNCQLYKQAGNSITVTVLEALFRQLRLKGVEEWNKIY